MVSIGDAVVAIGNILLLIIPIDSRGDGSNANDDSYLLLQFFLIQCC